MANEALANQNGRQGPYQFYKNINGKPSWKSETNAIWYYPEYKDWMIGPFENIGTDIRGITTWWQIGDEDYDCPQQVPSDKWVYMDVNGEWQYASSNDVSILCTTGKK